MLTTCIKFIKSRKKEIILITFTTIILSLISVFAFCAAADINKTKREEGFTAYGEFIVGGSVTDISSLPENELLKIGCFNIIDTFDYKNTSIPVGVVDDDFYSLSSCKIIDGETPKKENEIAVQRFALKLLDKKIGDTMTLNFEGVSKEYIITAILNNYSMNLSTNVDDPEESVYPVIILGKEYPYAAGTVNYLIGYKNSDNITGYDFFKEAQKVQKLIGSEYVHFFNDKLFADGFRYCEDIEFFSNLFICLVFIISGIICFILYRFLFDNIRRNYAIFSSLGKPFYFIKIITLLILLTTAFSMTIGMITFTAICSATDFFNNAVYLSGIRLLLFWFLSFLAGAFLVIVIHILLIKRKSVKENLQSNHLIEHSFKASSNVNTIFSIIKYCSIFLISFFCIFFVNVLRTDYNDYPDFTLISQEVDVSEIIKGYEVKINDSYSYDIGEINSLLEKYPEIDIALMPEVENTKFVIKADLQNPFFEEWKELYTWDDTTVTDSKFLRRWPSNTNDYTPLNNINYLIISEEEYNNLIKGSGNREDKNTTLIYFPSASDIDIKQNDIMLAGFDMAPDQIKFYLHDISIESYLYKSDISTILKNTTDFSKNLFDPEMITVFFNYEKLANNPLITGYKMADISLRDYSNYDSINDDINYLQSNIQGGSLYSKRDGELKAQSYNRYINTVNVILIVLTLILALIYSICSILLFIKKNKRRFGILMVLGKSTKRHISERRLSNLRNTVIAALIGFLAVVLWGYGNNILLQGLIYGLLPLAIIFLFMFIDNIIFKNFISRVTIRKCIY